VRHTKSSQKEKNERKKERKKMGELPELRSSVGMGDAVDCDRFIDKWPNLEREINRI
jgi:hypothetical protein